MARHAARAVNCDGNAVTLGPCADGLFVKRQGNKLVGAEITGGAAWGGITGTLSSQTDLQGALDGKENAGTAASAVAAHEAAGDPHTGYLTASEADLLYEAAGAVATHAGQADPHPGYLTAAEGNAAYATVDHTHPGGSGAPIDSWPVGSVFLSVVSTSPATLLGGGTWTQIAGGRVLIGQTGADADFDTAEETGGAKTSSAVVNHTHPVVVNDPQHSHVENSNNATTGGLRGWGAADTSTNTSTATGYSTAPASTGVTATTDNPAGGVASFSLMNPYFTVYIWKRTA